MKYANNQQKWPVAFVPMAACLTRFNLVGVITRNLIAALYARAFLHG